MPLTPSLLVALLLSLARPAAPDDPAALQLSNPRHVRALYLDALGRTPDSDEGALAASARPSMLVPLLISDVEFWQHWYEDELQYFLLLDNFRPADAPPGEGLPERLAAGSLGVLDAVRTLTAGSAFHRANPGNDTFVSVVFEQLLGLVVQRHTAQLESGKKMYDGKRSSLWGTIGNSQFDVVTIACSQPEFAEVFVARQYQRVVGLPAAPKQVRAWARRLEQDQQAFNELVGEWLLLPAYAERLSSLRRKTDRQFLRGLMVDLTGRLPDHETLSRARTALAAVADAGPLRSVIARVLLGSHGAGLPSRGEVEASRLVQQLYLRFLGRVPGPDERDAMIVLYQQCDCEPEILARALMTHWEYQYY
ncbi:MAG: hypothetical protein DRQ55_03660 [Planctomycetota bacterium]|nr:MAG: hypothetical protein DRQ55_03660 [Planctomycetota bacterium]